MTVTFLYPLNISTGRNLLARELKIKTAQKRDIYINKAGMLAKKVNAFHAGTVSIMEIYTVQKSPADNY